MKSYGWKQMIYKAPTFKLFLILYHFISLITKKFVQVQYRSYLLKNGPNKLSLETAKPFQSSVM